MSPERRDELVLAWGRRLGWALQRQQVKDVVYYDAGDPERGCLQVNTAPSLRAAVYAVKHGLFTGWYSLRLADDSSVQSEAARLSGLRRRGFRSWLGRRRLRRKHPAFAGFDWDRVRRVDSAELVDEPDERE